MRTPEQQQELIDAWLQESKKCAQASANVRVVLLFYLLIFPIGYFTFYLLGLPFLWLRILIVAAVYLSTVIYIWLKYNSIPRQIIKGRFRNITANQPQLIRQCIQEMAAKMRIPTDSIIVWVNVYSKTASPSIYTYKKSHHLLLPLGFFKIVAQDEELAKTIIAHELSHIRQRDADLFIVVKLFTRALLVVYIPILLVVLFVTTAGASYFSSYLEYNYGSDSFFELGGPFKGVGNGISLNTVFTVISWIFLISVLLYMRKLIYRSERVADLGAATFLSSGAAIKALQINDDIKRQSFFRHLFSFHPSVERRINDLKKVSNERPGYELYFEHTDQVIDPPPEFRPAVETIFALSLIVFLPINGCYIWMKLLNEHDPITLFKDGYDLRLIIMLCLSDLLIVILGLLAGSAIIDGLKGVYSRSLLFANGVIIISLINILTRVFFFETEEFLFSLSPATILYIAFVIPFYVYVLSGMRKRLNKNQTAYDFSNCTYNP